MQAPLPLHPLHSNTLLPPLHRELIDRIAKVTLEDVKRVALKYFTPLVQPKTSKTVVVCHPSSVQETISDLEK